MSEILLREVIESDLPVLYEQQLDPVAAEMAAFPSREREAFMAHWKKLRADESNIARTILYDGSVAGNIGSFMMGGEREVGYWIGREYWGKGIATAALSEFLKDIETRPLYAHVARHNVASRRVLEKCGFSLLREDKSYWEGPNREVEEYVFKLDGEGKRR